MRLKLSIIILLSVIFTQANAQFLETIEIKQTDFEVNYKYDDILKYENTLTFLLNDTVYGLIDQWAYVFEDGNLDCVSFLSYVDEIDQENFDLNLDASKTLINDFTELYGKPDEVIIGDTIFRDPYIERHWGYGVIEARWENVNGMKIKIGFDFFGGKGEYHFIFSVKYFDKSYPNFD
ncbi:MAG: hypothetical protein C0596_08865 [Marinilabiliales bacterium]|nr:MAG: hypothetical protein C0596_08865 [Marinilabiliales bacterium]